MSISGCVSGVGTVLLWDSSLGCTAPTVDLYSVSGRGTVVCCCELGFFELSPLFFVATTACKNSTGRVEGGCDLTLTSLDEDVVEGVIVYLRCMLLIYIYLGETVEWQSDGVKKCQ